MACALSLSFFVPTTLVMFYFFSPSQSILGGGDVYAAKPRKVDLTLYYEALCPGCSDFIQYDLQKVFQTDLSTIVNLRLVPWGNAEVINGNISCQHGENECYLNIIHACAIKAWPEVEKHFAFIRCVENHTASEMRVNQHNPGVEAAWRKCACEMGLAQEPIDSCYNSGEGTKLSLEYGEETGCLIPPHEYVPWVLVNKVAIKEHYPDYIKYVCKAYKGKPIEACKLHLSPSTLKETSVHPACSAEQSRNLSFWADENSIVSEPVKPPS